MGAGVAGANALGLPGGHAYTLMGAYIVQDANKVTHRLLQIRNPWGFDVYTGKWNSSSPLWTPAL